MTPFFDAIRRSGFRRGPRRVAGGLCDGIARPLNTSVGLVRVLMFVAFLLPGIGLGLYVVAWILLPWQDGSIPLERLVTGARRP